MAQLFSLGCKAFRFMKDTKHIVHISTDVGKHCEHCNIPVGIERFAHSVNHYIEQHGYKLLHVGMEAGRDGEGNLCHFTVAIVGK